MRKVNKTLKKKVMQRGIISLVAFILFTLVVYAPLWTQIVIASITALLFLVHKLKTKEDTPTNVKK